MKQLPKELQIKTLVNKRVPDDITIGELRNYVMHSKLMKEIKRSVRHPERVRLRFLGRPGTNYTKDVELADIMPLRAFRRLMRLKRAHIAIDDGQGGTPVRIVPEKVL